MVCKEDVLLWFKDLESYKRIDVMYELLNMCIPFEVRFLGSCVEEFGKHTFQELRGPTIIANDIERLSKDPTLVLGLLDETTRHRVVIYMSVLSARNCSCATWFYRTLFKSERVENFVNGCKDDNILSELLLLFTLGLYHPAFTFEQKCYFGKLMQKLVDAQGDRNKCTTSSNNPFPAMVTTNPTPRNFNSLPSDLAPVPIKTSSIMPGGDTLQIQHPPPGLPLPLHALGHPPLDFLTQTVLSRSGFPSSVVGVAEVHPFPPQPVSPLVSQTSPPQSRTASPHQSYMRPLPATSIQQLPLIAALHGEQITGVPALHVEPSLSAPTLPYNSPSDIVKSNGEDVNHLLEENIGDYPWQTQLEQLKPQNGIRGYQKFAFISEQLNDLKISADNSLHCSSPASSNSSITQSPTETPSVTPAVTPHGPGRGGPETKSRVNGIPPAFICDINSTPPPPFTNCTVPSFTIPAVPQSRYYSQPYRPHFSTPFPYPQSEVYPLPSYLVYSSMLPPQQSRNPNCYNCGGIGHSGVDCNGHTVEDITQKPYTLEYDSSSTLPDNSDK